MTDDGILRRHALQLAVQLPDERDDALRVLELLREVLDGFLAGDRSVQRGRGVESQP